MSKRILVIGMMVVFLMSVSGTVLAAPPQQEILPDSVTVVGYGTAYAAPDVAYVSVGVEMVNPDVTVAVNDATNAINAVNAALSEFGISGADVRTENFYIYRESVYSPEGIPSQGSFRVSHSLRVTVRDTAQVPQVLSAVLNAGANSIGGVQYDVEDKSALESQAREIAVANARAKADEMAALLGVTLGDVVAVVEVQNYGLPYGGFGGGGGGVMESVAQPPIVPGSLAVSVSVQISYAIVR